MNQMKPLQLEIILKDAKPLTPLHDLLHLVPSQLLNDNILHNMCKKSLINPILICLLP